MRIMPISIYSGNYRRSAVINQPAEQKENTQQPAFKGEAGKVAGALLGGALAVGLAFVAAPVLVCAAPALGIAGAVAGDEAEKKITGKDEDNK